MKTILILILLREFSSKTRVSKMLNACEYTRANLGLTKTTRVLYEQAQPSLYQWLPE